MSIFSRVKDTIVGIFTGTPSTHAIIDNPTTPVQQAINVAVPAVAAAVGLVPGVTAEAGTVEALNAIGTDVAHPATVATQTLTDSLATTAKQAADAYITQKIGAAPDAFIDASGVALAAAAIKLMPSASNKTEADVETALEGFLTDFFNAPAKT